MSVSIPVGIDFGTGKAVLGVARNRGIDIVVNEVSNRSTPSLVAFGPRSRFLGEAAKSQETSNIKNTVGGLKRLVGRSATDPDLETEKQFTAAKLTPVNDLAGIKVNYLAKPHEFNFTQLSAMFFNKLKSTLLSDTQGNINDVVISVPAYFVDSQRRAVADAAIIAGLNPVRIINDVSAAAIGHGVFRTDLPEDEFKTIAVVDIGYSDYTVSIINLKKGEGQVLSTETMKNFGGRDLDLIIAKHFAKIFQDKYKIDVTTNPKAWARVLQQSEKLKKILSANTSGMFNVESLMEDVDVSASMKRSELEEYLAPFLEKLHEPVQRALQAANVKAEDLDAVEVIGGTTRVPCVKEKVSEAFGNKALSYTMNQDEAVARGAAFVCAVHSPLVRVRPFKFEDVNLHSVTFSWEKSGDEDTDRLEVFPKGSAYPSTKVITLFRSADFELRADYTNPKDLDAGIDSHIGKWKVVGVQPAKSGEPVAVKLKIRQDPSGLYVVESAYTAEEQEVEETTTDEQGEEKVTKTKKWVKQADLVIEHFPAQLSVTQRDQFTELEAQMAAEDKLVEDTENRKNALEEYIYDIRDKLEGILAEFAKSDEKERLLKLADAAEEWLYGDGEDASKGQYVAKLEELASIGNLIKGRHTSKIEEERQAKLAKKEAEQQQKMAEKLQAQKAAREQAEKEAAEKAGADGDAPMPDQE